MPRPLTTAQLLQMHDECIEDRFAGRPMCEWCRGVEAESREPRTAAGNLTTGTHNMN